MSPSRTVEERLDEIESRTAIAELLATYCFAADTKDLDLWLTIWHDDAAYLIPGGLGEFYGTEGMHHALDAIDAAWEKTWHWPTNHSVRFESPDRAIGRTYVVALGTRPADAGTAMVSGQYNDVFERRDGVWKFAERSVTRFFVTTPVDFPLPAPH